MEEKDPTSEVDNETYAETCFSAVSAIIYALTDSTRDFAESEFKRIAEAKEVRNRIKDVMPYLYAGAFLSFSGREINEKNITKVLKVAGMPSNPKLIKLLFKTKIKSHFPYIYAYYFLLALGKSGSEAEILDMVDSLGLHMDKARIKDVLNFLSPKKRAR